MSTGSSIPLDLERVGKCDRGWIFQVTGDVDVTADLEVVLSGGARAKSMFWQVDGSSRKVGCS
jgi:hypothetical protein